jgi:hypothetical protein
MNQRAWWSKTLLSILSASALLTACSATPAVQGGVPASFNNKLKVDFSACARVTGDQAANVYCDVNITNQTAKTVYVDIRSETKLLDGKGDAYPLQGVKVANAPFTSSDIRLQDFKANTIITIKLRFNVPLNISKMASMVLTTYLQDVGLESLQLAGFDVKDGGVPELPDLGGRTFAIHNNTMLISLQSCYRVTNDPNGNLYCDFKLLNLIANKRNVFVNYGSNDTGVVDPTGNSYSSSGTQLENQPFSDSGSYTLEYNSIFNLRTRFNVPLTVIKLNSIISKVFLTTNSTDRLQIDNIDITP